MLCLLLDACFWPPLESSWLSPTCLVLSLSLRIMSTLGLRLAQVHTGFPPSPSDSTCSTPATIEPGTWPAAAQWFWQWKRFKIFSLAKQLPFFPLEKIPNFSQDCFWMLCSFYGYICLIKLRHSVWYPVSPGSGPGLPEFYLHHILSMGHIWVTKSDFYGQFGLQSPIKLWVKLSRTLH